MSKQISVKNLELYQMCIRDSREKVFLIDALRNKYKLNELLPVLKLSKSSYCYQVQCIKSKDKYKELRQQIKELFMCNKEDVYKRQV